MPYNATELEKKWLKSKGIVEVNIRAYEDNWTHPGPESNETGPLNLNLTAFVSPR
jgi:hypothetical protein